MNSILLRTSEAIGKLPIGSSKVFGNPDVWEKFVWPSIVIDGEEYDLTFMCQINCAEVSRYDTDGLLPINGMLYFFYDLDGMPWQLSDINAAKVIYYNNDISELHEMVLTDECGESIAFSEQKIEYQSIAEGFLSDKEPTHLLLGVPSLEVGPDVNDKDYQMLLQLDSFETKDASINFTDEGVLCFFIEKDKLKVLDFSDVRIKQIYL